jgi:hypothetical protein
MITYCGWVYSIPPTIPQITFTVPPINVPCPPFILQPERNEQHVDEDRAQQDN